MAQEQRAAAQTPWIVPQRVQGLRRAVAVAVGEKHSVALQVQHPRLPPSTRYQNAHRSCRAWVSAGVRMCRGSGSQSCPRRSILRC